ncbi:MAG: hypothetical protein GX308_05670 [Epulopiscium sp.]|nr:hypothetical protein [Candidatus Epulonipiscium sp.]
MMVLTIGAIRHIEEVEKQISLEFSKITPKALIPTYTSIKKGEIDFLYYEIKDEVLAKNYNFFFSDAIKLYASSSITEIILEFVRFDIIKEILEYKFPKYSHSEHSKIIYMIKSLLTENEDNDDRESIYYSYRKEIMSMLMDFFEDSNEFVLEGFIQFRLQEYKRNLEKIIVYIIKEYEAQKEYKEFLRLLKYFVDTQETKEETIHIVGSKEGRFRIYDKDKKDITERCEEEFEEDFKSKSDNYDDLLVSTLITIAPRQILIHHYELIQNKTLIETINNIFQGKVTICSTCEFCKNFHGNQLT